MTASDLKNYAKQEILKYFWENIHYITNAFADKIAVKSKYSSINFSSLNHQSNIISTKIRETVTETGVGVGILGKDGVKISPLAVGIIKSGNYVITIDPTFPSSLQEFILKDSNSKILLTDSDHYQQAMKLGKNHLNVINIDAIAYTNDVQNPKIKFAPDQITHMIYTSGTTGKPKGVILQYKYIARAINNTINSRSFSSSDRIASFSSFTFVGPQMLIFSILMTGATLCHYNLKNEGFVGIADWLRDEQITYFSATPSVYRRFVSTLKPEDKFPDVRLFHLGAEKKFPQDVKSFTNHFPPDCTLAIGFSSTETSRVCNKIYVKDFDFKDDIVPAGNPLEDIKVFIWDENGKVVPKGETGEIVVKGDALAKGYWNNPELTAQKFLKDPNNPELTIFRSGDLGKFLPDGQLQHLGRLDDLVKIKGIRIELASVESHLLSYPGITQAAAKPFEDPHKNMKLVGYFVPEDGINIPTSDIRKFLSERLPLNMLPHYFIALDNIPLNQNGKVDRQALPLPNLTRPNLAYPYAAPTNEIEKRLVKILQENIGIEGIGINDDYFELGGDSLTAVLLFVQIDEIFHRKLPVSLLLTNPTIRKLAEVLQQEDISQDWSPIIPLKAQGNGPTVLFIPGKGGYPIRFRYLANRIQSDNPLYAVQSWGVSGKGKPFYTTEENAKYFINEIKSISPHGSYILCGESAGGMIAYEMAQQLIAQGEKVLWVVMFDTFGPGSSGMLQFPDSPKAKLAYYYMLMKKHLQILLRSSLAGKRDYVRIYWKVLPNLVENYQQILFKRKALKQSSLLPKELREVDRANIIAASRYKPLPYPGKVVLFRANRNPTSINKYNGWDNVKIGELIVHNLDCYHGNILFDPFISQVASQLSTYFNQNGS